MAGRKGALVTAIGSAEECAQILAEPQQRALLVLDVHKQWCGPCTVIESLYKKLSLDYDRSRLRFYTVEDSFLPPELKAGLLHPGSKPAFLLVKDKVVLSRVFGVNAPDLEAQIGDSVPPVEAE